ncbi:MAG: hypothetical protein M3R35_06670 [Candidatus Eremiobacteraeota bacterium]|nr:hypothetical protein [Candidatus Eremiobacteraeota bacterium]
MRAKWCHTVLQSIAVAACMWSPASAAVSIAGGGFIQDKPSQTGAAVIVSSGDSIPAFPLELQGSLLVPLTSRGGYAVTAEIRGFTGGGFGGAYVGAGAGVGNLSSDRSTGPVLTVFGGKSFSKNASIELRLYKATGDLGATAGFVGVRFSL